MPEFSERFFRSGPLRIHFRDWGNVGAPPLILVHGLRDHSHSFDDLARGLLDRFHVLALDLRGHGDSETTPYYAFGHFVLDLHNMVRALRLERPVLIGHSMGGEVVANYSGVFADVPARVVIIEGLGPPPVDMDEELRWTLDGFARIDRAFASYPGLADLEAAYQRLRSRNPRLPETKARELALLGTRAREDGTLEWKFDAMLTTMSITGPFPLDLQHGRLAPHQGPDADHPRRRVGRVLALEAGGDLSRPGGSRPPPGVLRRRPLPRDRRRRPHGALRPAARAGHHSPRVSRRRVTPPFRPNDLVSTLTIFPLLNPPTRTASRLCGRRRAMSTAPRPGASMRCADACVVVVGAPARSTIGIRAPHLKARTVNLIGRWTLLERDRWRASSPRSQASGCSPPCLLEQFSTSSPARRRTSAVAGRVSCTRMRGRRRPSRPASPAS
ncbi:MAG: alpha/beta fold hydrolase [Candidatus Binatia bacterium]